MPRSRSSRTARGRLVGRTGPGVRARRSGPLRSPYLRSAAVYDQVYAWKDYAAEARRIREVVRRYGPRRARSLLDVACGTGEHLRYLVPHFELTGIDANEAMLRVARRKLPRVRWIRGRMQTFRLGARFDVITCLFSAIGYARSNVELGRILRNFARHLLPGGVAIVEPWLTPETYRTGGVHLATYGTKDAPIARMNTHELRRGRSVMAMHYLAGRDGRIHYWVERHDMGLFDTRTMMEAFRWAGLRPRRIASGFTTRRGLYVGVKPREPDRT